MRSWRDIYSALVAARGPGFLLVPIVRVLAIRSVQCPSYPTSGRAPSPDGEARWPGDVRRLLLAMFVSWRHELSYPGQVVERAAGALLVAGGLITLPSPPRRPRWGMVAPEGVGHVVAAADVAFGITMP